MVRAVPRSSPPAREKAVQLQRDETVQSAVWRLSV